jgi:ATP-dependent RNA helicase DDX55/SPB4
MPELRNRLVQRDKKQKGGASGQWYLPNFEPAGPEVDIFAIPFLDPHREGARQKRLRESPSRHCGEKSHKGEAKRPIGQDQASKSGSVKADKTKIEKKRSRHAKILEEWDDLAKEERLYKKLRKKKVTQEQLESELYGDGEEVWCAKAR